MRLRRTLIVNRRLQYAFLAFLVLWHLFVVGLVYMAFCYLLEALAVFAPRNLEGQLMMEQLHGQVLIILGAIALAMLAVNALLAAFTLNRIFGPLHRLYRHLVADAEGERLSPLHFRQGDALGEVGEAYNHLVERVGPRLLAPSPARPPVPDPLS